MDDKKVLQNVLFDPPDFLKFDGKLEDAHQKTIIMTNSTDVVVTFKCKGTSPEHIKIRPGYGYLKPTEKALITLNVMPLNTRPRPPINERLVVLIAVASPNYPTIPMHMWRGGSIPKDPRRFVLPLKFQIPGSSKNTTKCAPKPTKEVKTDKKPTENTTSTNTTSNPTV